MAKVKKSALRELVEDWRAEAEGEAETKDKGWRGAVEAYQFCADTLEYLIDEADGYPNGYEGQDDDDTET